MIQQFFVYAYHGQKVVVLTNTVFNDVESILVAPVKTLSPNKQLITDLQIPVQLEGGSYFVDLLDIATVSKRHLSSSNGLTLKNYRTFIKAGIDLLIDGF